VYDQPRSFTVTEVRSRMQVTAIRSRGVGGLWTDGHIHQGEFDRSTRSSRANENVGEVDESGDGATGA